MIRKLLGSVSLAVLLGTGYGVSLAYVTVTTPACAAHQAFETPRAKVLYTADQVTIRVNELMNTAIAAQENGSLSLTAAHTIVSYCVDADKILAEAAAGWQKVVSTSWTQAKPKFGVTSPKVTTAIAVVDAVMTTLLEGGVQ